MQLRQVTRCHVVAFCAALAFSATGLHAGTIAVDHAVPVEMDEGGTSEDPAHYVIGSAGPVHIDFDDDAASIGTYNSHNHLTIQSGSTLTNAGNGPSIGWSGNHNRVTVTGAGSAWITTGGDGYMAIGWGGSHNQLVLENGGQVSNSSFADIGRGETSSHNSVLIRGAGSVWSTDPISFAGGGHHTLTIAEGGRLETGTGYTWLGQDLDENNVGNRVLVTGRNSVWRNEGGLVMDDAFDATLTIADGGLVTLENTYGLYLSTGLESFIRFDGGFLALWGNHVDEMSAYISDGLFQYWNGQDWASGSTENFIFGRYNEADAFSLTGYSGLAGYTIVTNIPVSPIPEPSTYAALAGAAALGLAVIRRRRARSS